MIHSHVEPWLPSFDLHEQDGELVLHADLDGYDESMEISLDGDALVVRTAAGKPAGNPVCYSRLPLPFAPQTWRAVSRPGQAGVEIHLPIPEEVIF